MRGGSSIKFKKKVLYKIKEAYELGLDRHEKEIVNSVLNSKDFGKLILNVSPEVVSSIAFIVPGIDRYSGGLTSILRLGTYIAQRGYKITYVDYTDEKISELKRNAKANLPEYEGEIVNICSTKNDDFDIVIAGNWLAVYYLAQFNAYKMYFVQDYEPYFFKLNERYLLAKLTYELGLHIVSLGEWNLTQISRECITDSRMDYITFPYEPKEYHQIKKRDYSTYKYKKKISIAVYTKEEGKRIPNILQYILRMTKEEFKNIGIELDIKFFGLRKSYRVAVGENLGKLSKDKLLELYQNSDFGMVASMTNVSLVPYEMLAVGLPIIEFSKGSYASFLPVNSAILVDYDYQTLFAELQKLIRNYKDIEIMMSNAVSSMKQLSWEKTADQFDMILHSL